MARWAACRSERPMPRKRPKQVRAEHWRPRRGVPVVRIRGVTAATRVAIHRLEDERLWAGAVVAALRECRRHLEQPGRVLPDPVMGCACCDPLVARDLLEDVLRWLPRGARTDLGRLVARMDAEFARRSAPLGAHLTLPPPFGACGPWRQWLGER